MPPFVPPPAEADIGKPPRKLAPSTRFRQDATIVGLFVQLQFDSNPGISAPDEAAFSEQTENQRKG
jgi:hypothetical protein